MFVFSVNVDYLKDSDTSQDNFSSFGVKPFFDIFFVLEIEPFGVASLRDAKRGLGWFVCYRAMHPLRDACYRAFLIVKTEKQGQKNHLIPLSIGKGNYPICPMMFR